MCGVVVLISCWNGPSGAVVVGGSVGYTGTHEKSRKFV